MQRVQDVRYVEPAQPPRDPNSADLRFRGRWQLLGPNNRQRLIDSENVDDAQEDVLAEKTRRLSRASSRLTPIGYSVDDSFCLYIYQADITKLPVDAIVNAANVHLIHNIGLANTIASAAGPNMVKESQTLAEMYRLGVKSVVKTTSGFLPCKAVLHAIGPEWPKTRDENMMNTCRKQLMDTYINVIKKANFEKYRSIAVPPISSGVYGVPADILVKALIDAILSSSTTRQKSTLKEIHIVDTKDDLLEKLARHLSVSELHRAPNGTQVAIRELPKAISERAMGGKNRGGIIPRKLPTAARTTPSSSAMESETPIYAEINKRRGVNREPEHDSNADYEDTAPPIPAKDWYTNTESDSTYSDQGAEWERGTTTRDGGGKASARTRKPLPPLPRKPVPRPVCTHYADSDVYELAGPSEYANASSVLDTRPNELVSSEASLGPIYEQPDTLVVDRNFYNYAWLLHGDVMQQIHDAGFIERAAGPSSRDPNYVELRFRSVEGKQRFAASYANLKTRIYAESTPADDGPSQVAPAAGKLTPIGYSVGDSFRLYVCQADITKMAVDAIVNAANEHMIHGGGIARKIADAAGPKLISESQTLAKKYQLGVTSVIKTTSGKLPCKAVLHAIGPKWPETTDLQMIGECGKHVMETYLNTIDQANSQQYKSIAMPPISSGIFGVPGDIVITALIDALLITAVKSKRSKLKQIFIVDIKDDLLEQLARWLSDRDLHRAPNGKQVAIRELPEAEVKKAINETTGDGTKSKKSRWSFGFGRKKKKK